MIRSMTGYAQVAAQDGPWSLTLSVRGLNHRYLDLQFRLPVELAAAEPRLKQIVRGQVTRGRVEIQTRLEQVNGRSLQIDRNFLNAIFEIHEEIRRERGLSAEPSLTEILRMPGVLRQETAEADSGESDRLAALAEKALGEALSQLNVMREQEGEALGKEFNSGIVRLREARAKVAELCESILPAEKKRLQEKLRELLGEGTVDEARLAEEAAYRAERGDISEELARLASHTDQFAGLLKTGDGVGKRLDFLLQEMNRESNTILSKTPGLGNEGLEITRFGLDMKSEIERLREQVQNVE